MKDKKRRTYGFLTGLLLILSVCLTSCGNQGQTDSGKDSNTQSGTKVAAEDHSAEEKGSDSESYVTVDDVPAYSGEPYVEVNDNQPEFTEEELTTVSYEDYSELDELGRCQLAEACIGQDLMPTEARESISSVKPTGWKNKSYDTVDGGYVYNRCHLIGFQLTGENANEENLITGTRYMNVEGMLPFEDEVAAYIKETDNHVMYRVTPVFEGDDLVASGVQMQAESVEDDGVGISFNVYVYNVQPYVVIDYKTGENWEGDEIAEPEGKWADGTEAEPSDTKEQMYILNKNTKKFHKPECSGAKKIKAKNKGEYTGSRQTLIDEGYEPCGNCNP
ncbi:DNA/RNA non-specific endonuclease [[Ruminococcus] lactaris]|jgi:DNA-entry nuclease|uniref:DNA/RNA non-specific endonuclease n=1 Tax=[Ruminococcus] lactaris TaxID=46228 RepID=UPI003522C61B